MTASLATTTLADPSTDGPAGAYTSSELLTVISCRLLQGKRRVFAGIGLPTLAVALAQATTSPDIEQIYESGVCGAHPPRLPETIADASLATGAESILSMAALFGYVLQGGWIDVGFLGAAQIDRFGSLNSTVIGDWDQPEVRLPGSGGAAEVMANSQEVFVVMRRHDRRSFVSQLDYCTSPSIVRSKQLDPKVRTRGSGVTTVITDLGVLTASANGELELSAIHPGATIDQVVSSTGWPLKVSDHVQITQAPSEEELRVLRHQIDSNRVYLR